MLSSFSNLTLKNSSCFNGAFLLLEDGTYKFKVCRSVHHRTIHINHQTDTTVFQFIILTFIYSSTCFGHSPAHHQKLNDCSNSLWFYLRIVVIAVLFSWSGRPAWWFIWVVPIVWTETSIQNYQTTPLKIPEERRTDLQGGGSWKSRVDAKLMHW